MSQLDGQAILKLLPHRFPLLLVDRVTECVPGEHIAGVKNIANGEPLVDAAAAFPSLLVLEALAQLSVILTFRTLERDPTGTELMLFAGIDNARFHAPIVAGDRLLLSSRLKRLRRGLGVYLARCEVAGRLVAEAQLTAAWRIAADQPVGAHETRK